MKYLSMKIFMLCIAACILSSCGSTKSSSVWAKKSSPWEQRESPDYRQNIDAEAPASDSYKEELAAVEQSLQEVELTYQAEAVESFVPVEPAAAIEDNAVENLVEEAVLENDSVDEIYSVLNLPPNYYTVQLMASVDMDRIYKFAEQNHLSTHYVVATHRNNTVWYVLLLDVYTDYSSAKAAMNEVLTRVKTTPWIRKLSGIQKIMQSTQ